MKLSGSAVLSFLDLAKYLAYYGYEYNVDNSDDRNNLRTVILNLCSDYMLRTTFYYSGAATISKYKYKNGDDFKIISTVKKKITGDFILDIDVLLKLLQNNEPIHLDGQSFDIFTAIGLDDEPILHNHREQARKANSYFFSVKIGGEIESPVIKMGDLHYVRADIDKAIKIGFFDHITGREQAHEKTQQLIIEAQAKITDLKNQLKQAKAEQAKAEQADAPADDKEPSSIARYNANKAYVIATSQALASYLWSMDTTQAIRTGDMVQQVRHVMHSVAPDLLPDDKAIRGWLSDIAPDYAKKGGKTPKDTPSEISLTMKK
tara:strand:- start:1853 stop:2809 length:957 start_codon:yes stop_codon:yes gene_type:complete